MFNELIGNEKIKENLNKILQNKTVSHSYMFIGTKGIGKKLFAREFAKRILCISKEKMCESCKSCIEFVNNNNPDYYEVKLEDDENSIKIDTIRQMQKKVQELSIVSDRKVYVIDDAECMTKDAQNCLLKTLEEPPKFVTIILIVSDENKILNTIKSRCLKLYFNSLSEEEILKYIKEDGIETLPTNMIEASGGSIGKLKQIYVHKELYIQIDNIFNNIEAYSITDITSKMEILYKNKEIIQQLLEYINTLLIKKAKNNIRYIEYIKYVEEAKRDLNLNCNYDMCIDKLLFNILKN